MLIEVHELQKKVEDADLAGLKDASKLSPEEQELLEEMEGISMSSFGSEGESKPGEPIFSFVSVVSPEEHDQALADAFQKAKLQAARLAKAAGAKLGTLQSINGSRDQSDDFINYGGYGYNQYAYQLLQGAFESEEEWDEDKLEALGVKPGKVTYTIRVRASFELNSP